MKYTSLKILNALIHASTNTRNAVGVIIGSVMRKARVKKARAFQRAYS